MESDLFSVAFFTLHRLNLRGRSTANEGEKFPGYFHAGRPNGFGRGCHYGSYDDHRDYGYSSSSGSYREGFRDGRATKDAATIGVPVAILTAYGYYRR